MHKRVGLTSFFLLSILAACGGEDSGPSIADGAAPVADADPGQAPDSMPTFDAALPADARQGALACAGDPLPDVVAAPPVVISGAIQEATFGGIVAMTASAHVSSHQLAGDVVIAEGDFTGSYSLTDPTNSTVPLEAYLKSVVTGYLDTYVFPPAALSEDMTSPVMMLSTTILGFLGGLGITHDASDSGILIIAVVDCDQAALEGAIITTVPATELLYAGANGLPGATPFTETQAPGIAYAFNVPPGDYQVSAVAADGTDLRTMTAKSFIGATSAAVVAP